jgi:nucleoside-diphosphate-sugar epimerase
MKVLVTGADGYIGSQLVSSLSLDGHEVVSFDLRQGDNILDLDQVDEAAKGCEWIIHLAGVVGIGACEKNPNAWDVNVEGTRNVLRQHKNVIYSSVLAGYKSQSIDETTPVFPTATYYKSKLEAEALVEAAGQTILRFGALYGVNPYVFVSDAKVVYKAMRSDLMVHSFCKEAIETKRLTIFQPNCMRPVTSLDDAVASIKFMMGLDLRRRGIFNIVSYNVMKALIADLIRERTGCRLVPIEGEDTEGRNYIASPKKVKDAGFVFKAPPLGDTIKEICDWYEGVW